MTHKRTGSPARSGVSRDEADKVMNLGAHVEAEPFVELHREEVARRALQLWRVAGKPAGRDLEYWLQAEMELLSDRLGRRSSSVSLAEAA